MLDLISVIIPVYNVERYLERCVESVRNQTYTNLEIILVDDGSPDRCPQMCDEYAFEDKRIRVIHKENGGQGYARNDGLTIATGEYVTFIDSDDWISSDHIENLYRQIKENDADVAIGAHTVIGNGEERKVRYESLEAKVYRHEEIRESILMPLIGTDEEQPRDVQVDSSSSMSLYRMSTIKENAIWYESERIIVGEDLFFNIDFLNKAEKAVVVEEYGYYYFQNEESTSRKYNKKRFQKTLCFYELLRERTAVLGIHGDNVKRRVYRNFLMKVRVAIRHIVCAELSIRRKYAEIYEVLEHSYVQDALRYCADIKYVMAMRLLMQLMRKKNVIGVYCLMKFREIAKKQKRLRKALERIGIGK
ncbi:MAG: glycosyltransferase family 2 protein [Clostridia bacterium]|nr:glycosyltransferase family 2 protein [Clostridia bacterium]